jgi:tetratricopeptide (TPR) repeat protein
VNEEGDLPGAAEPELADAIRLYNVGDLQNAARALHSAATTNTRISKQGAAAARLFLAKALYKMGYRAASLPLFDGISADATHPQRLRALPWLVRLADELPDDGPILRAIGRYSIEDINVAARAQPEAFVGSALYYRGRAAYDRGRFDEALAALRGVPSRSPAALRARFFEGMSLLRSDDNDAAEDALKTVAQAAEKAEAAGMPAEDAARLRDLAWLAVARMDYAAAAGAGGDESVGALQRLEGALQIYSKVTPSSEYIDEARLERGWIYLRLGQYDSAIASLDDLSPLFLETNPEAHYLRVLVYYKRCDVKRAAAEASAFRRDYGVRSEDVERLDRASDEALRSARDLSPHMPAVVKTAMAQRDVKRRFELLAILAAEKDRLATAPPEIRASALGGAIARNIADAEEAASARITAILRARCDRFVKESREEISKSDSIDIEAQAILGGASKCPSRR